MRRHTRSSSLWVAAFMLYFLFVAAPAAHAYIDPASGSMVWQAVVAGLLGAAVGIKVFWRRIMGFFTRRPAKDRTAESE
jgi:hypothetical protein